MPVIDVHRPIGHVVGARKVPGHNFKVVVAQGLRPRVVCQHSEIAREPLDQRGLQRVVVGPPVLGEVSEVAVLGREQPAGVRVAGRRSTRHLPRRVQLRIVAAVVGRRVDIGRARQPRREDLRLQR